MNSARTSSDDLKETSVDGENEERASSGQTAGPSGRCHAIQQAGETWDQEEFAKSDKKKPGSVMVEFPAGSNVWYNGVPQKWTNKEVLFRIGVESREEAPCVWIHLTSSRIWRGSNAGNTWTYSGRGSWRPKRGCLGKRDKTVKNKGKVRKRKLVEDNQGSEVQNDDLTCTTKATLHPESDEENVIEQCPSPLPIKGSNAVSPEGEAPKQGFSKPQEDQNGAVMLQVLTDKLVPNADGQCKEPGPNAGLDVKYSQWLYRHHCLLQRRGLLNLAPSGCNPEAGRTDSLLTSSAIEESLRAKETSSSSGSARQKQDAGYTAAAFKGKGHHGASLLRGASDRFAEQARSKPSSFEPPRSPSPSTPSKPAVGSRRQRSSSADLDPRSTTAVASLNEREARQGKQEQNQQPEQSSKPQSAVLKSTDIEKAVKQSRGHLSKPISRALSAAAAVTLGKDSRVDSKDPKPSKRARLDAGSKQAGSARAGKRQMGTNQKPLQQLVTNSSAPSVLTNREEGVPQKGFASLAVSALVETDPFAKNDIIRCKAC